MKPISKLFDIHRAKSDLYDDYESGDVAFIGNGLGNNAVTGFVTPNEGDKTFSFLGITLSAFCEATVQSPPFIACSRAGNGLLVLEPKKPMTVGQLAHYAAYINLAVRWRFNWYRQITKDRVREILVPNSFPKAARLPVREAMPDAGTGSRDDWKLRLRPFALDDLYLLASGDFHSLSALAPGTVPVVSCGDADNGVSGYFDVKKPIYQRRLTIALNGMNTLNAKFGSGALVC